MEKERPTLHSLTLRFKDKRIEKAFGDHSSRAEMRPVIVALTLLVVVLAVDLGIRILYYKDLSPARAVQTVALVLVTAYIGFMFTPLYMKVRTVCAIVGMTIMCVFVCLMVYLAVPERQPYLVGLVYLLLLLTLGLPLEFTAKVSIGAIAIGSFLCLAVATNIFGEAFLPVISTHMGICYFMGMVLAYMFERTKRERYIAERDLELERARSEALLLNTLPASIARRLKAAPEGDGLIVDRCEEAAVLFADIVGFTPLAAGRPASEIVTLLNDIFSRFDVLTARSGAEKIKTIGDAYMAVAGLPEPCADPLTVIVELALELRDAATRYQLLTGEPLSLRLGIHIGPVVAGVIGKSRYLYDLWGDTVNVASRLESTSLPGQIQVTAEVAARLADRYELAPRGRVTLKGRGEVETVFVIRQHMTATRRAA